MRSGFRKDYAVPLGSFPRVSRRCETWFPDYLSTLPRVRPETRALSVAQNHPGRVPKRGDFDPLLPQASDHPRLARPGRFRLGYRERRDRLERQRGCHLSRYSRRSAGQRRGIRQADRAARARSAPTRSASPPPARGGDGAPYRIEYGVRASDLRAGALDRGNRLLVCRPRRQAGARAGHRPRQQ